jgi:hypothetical protein
MTNLSAQMRELKRLSGLVRKAQLMARRVQRRPRKKKHSRTRLSVAFVAQFRTPKSVHFDATRCFVHGHSIPCDMTHSV